MIPKFFSTVISGVEVPTLKNEVFAGVVEPTEKTPRNDDVAVVDVALKYSPTTCPTTESGAYGDEVPNPTFARKLLIPLHVLLSARRVVDALPAPPIQVLLIAKHPPEMVIPFANVDVAVVEATWIAPPATRRPPPRVVVAVVVPVKWLATTSPTTESFAYGEVVPMPTEPEKMLSPDTAKLVAVAFVEVELIIVRSRIVDDAVDRNPRSVGSVPNTRDPDPVLSVIKLLSSSDVSIDELEILLSKCVQSAAARHPNTAPVAVLQVRTPAEFESPEPVRSEKRSALSQKSPETARLVEVALVVVPRAIDTPFTNVVDAPVHTF